MHREHKLTHAQSGVCGKTDNSTLRPRSGHGVKALLPSSKTAPSVFLKVLMEGIPQQ